MDTIVQFMLLFILLLAMENGCKSPMGGMQQRAHIDLPVFQPHRNFPVNTVSSVSTTDATIGDGAAVRDVVNSAYCNGAYDALDIVAMAQGFHPGFAIVSSGTDQLERYTIAE